MLQDRYGKFESPRIESLMRKRKKKSYYPVMDEELLASSRMKCFYFVVMMATESIEVDMRLLFW
ncbi:unnamed protein product [Musa banksii]